MLVTQARTLDTSKLIVPVMNGPLKSGCRAGL